jgi:peptide deformylase
MDLTIRLYPNPVLCEVATPVTRVDKSMRAIMAAMLTLMYRKYGSGLAASQVGIAKRFIVLNVTGDKGRPEEEMVFINPVITKRFGGYATATEGCLSFPGDYGSVRRAKKIVLNAFTLDGEEVDRTFTGLQARTIQHECDHLDGVLFIDRNPALKEEICSS